MINVRAAAARYGTNHKSISGTITGPVVCENGSFFGLHSTKQKSSLHDLSKLAKLLAVAVCTLMKFINFVVVAFNRGKQT